MSNSSDAAHKGNLAIYLRLLTYVKPFWFWFLISIVGYAIFACSQPMYAKLVEYFLKALENNSTAVITIPVLGQIRHEKLIFFVPVTLLITGLFAGIGSFMGSYFLAKVAINVVNKLRQHLFSHLLKLNCKYFDNHNSGHLVAKITYNTNQVTSAATDALKVVIREGLTVLFLLGYLFYTQWKLTLIFIVFAPLIGVLVNLAGKKFRKMSQKIQNSIGDVTHVASEVITNYRVVRSFNGEDYEKKRFFSACYYNLRQLLKMGKLSAVSTPILRFLVMVALAILMYIALYMKTSGNITTSPGELIAFLTAAGMLPKPVRQLSEVYGEIQIGIVAAQSIFELVDQIPENDQGTFNIDRVKGHLEIRNLSFTYDQADKPALQNISFTVKPGETVALVGRSGSGKTTLMNLLTRYYEVNEGEILLDGKNINEYTLACLRKQIAQVEQRVNLFSTSLKNNIAYGVADDGNHTDHTDHLIQEAVAAACAAEFIERLPEGIDTPVGENGVKLSGGQRQRIAIARALFKNAPVLILDEATSALDTESERHIQKALEAVMNNRTTLVIAHRLSTIEKADKILVMKEGRIIESGTHQTLLAMNGTYTHLYNMQFNEHRSA